MSRLLLAPFSLCALLAATPAGARPQPTPPPSGIVVHLFGPDSITGHILPTGPAPSAAGAAGGTARTMSTSSPPQAASAQAPAGTPAAAPLTTGDILHQMFVTGDPAQEAKPRFATGRTRP